MNTWTTLALLLAASCSGASAALITNGSFETGTATFGTDGGARLNPGNTSLAGWSVIVNDVIWLETPNVYELTTLFGSHFLDLTGYTDQAPYGGVSQSINDLTPGTNYTLTYYLMSDVGSRFYGGTVGASATIFGSTQNCTFSPSSNPTGNQVQLCSDSFTATGTSTTLSIVGLQGYEYIGLDDVNLVPSNSIPEPTMAVPMLLGFGLLFGGSIRRAVSHS